MSLEKLNGLIREAVDLKDVTFETTKDLKAGRKEKDKEFMSGRALKDIKKTLDQGRSSEKAVNSSTVGIDREVANWAKKYSDKKGNLDQMPLPTGKTGFVILRKVAALVEPLKDLKDGKANIVVMNKLNSLFQEYRGVTFDSDKWIGEQ